uniref:Uncharacterized protein n=1 Tax=Oryza punctata TaxID=4537 RepID=A0A0E0LTL1_ORYPU
PTVVPAGSLSHRLLSLLPTLGLTWTGRAEANSNTATTRRTPKTIAPPFFLPLSSPLRFPIPLFILLLDERS